MTDSGLPTIPHMHYIGHTTHRVGRNTHHVGRTVHCVGCTVHRVSNTEQGLVKGVELCLNLTFLAGWRSELAGCRRTLSMSKIKVKISEAKFLSFYKTLVTPLLIYKGKVAFFVLWKVKSFIF